MDSIIDGFIDMAEERQNRGFDGYFLSFMFNPLPGSDRAKQKTMEEEVIATYHKLLTRTFRHPKNVAAMHKPFWLAAPDLPVPKIKKKKDNYRDTVVNDGLHYHAIAMTPPGTRMKVPLSDFINHEQIKFSGIDRYLFRLHALPIETDLARIVRYALKALLTRSFDLDCLLVLPRAQSERPSRTRYERLSDKHAGELRRRTTMPGRHRRSEEAAKIISHIGLE